MPTKLDEVRALLEAGYQLDDVRSDEKAVEASFRLGAHVVLVRFLADEAEALLLSGTAGAFRRQSVQ